jgi:hypothetical protein
MGIGERPPESVRRYEVPFNAEIRALYPYLDDYSVGYLVRFPDPAPKPSSQAAVEHFAPVEAQFIAAGALGKMLFRWRLDGGPELPPSAEPGPEQRPATTPKQ